METINVLIIEDVEFESDLLKDVLIKNNYNVVGVATNFNEAIELYKKELVDILIIDVFLNGKPDGINFAETISKIPNNSKPFVFLTSSKNRQIFERAKLTQPFSFLMKPFNELEVLYAIEMAVDKYYSTQDNVLEKNSDNLMASDFLFIKKKNSLKKISLKDIIYIEVEERYCSIITREEKFVIQMSLKKIFNLLDTKIFAQTHRNFIINTNEITEVVLKDNLIILNDKYKVGLTDNYKDFINNYQILK